MKFVMYMSHGRGYFQDLYTGRYEVRELIGWRKFVGRLYNWFNS
jgi:hypothetical protein